MAAPVTEEKQQHQATTAEPAGNSAATHATNPGTTSTDNHDNPPSFEDATGISSRDANTVTSPPLVGSPPARDLPPGIVNEDQATNSPGVNNYGYVASPPGGMNHPQGMGQPVVNYEGAPQMVTPLGNLGEGPALIDCPYCHRRAMTKTDKEGTSMQMIAGAICCLFCICLTCVPCLAGWCENVNIHCSACGKRVATIPHDGTIQVHWPQTHTQVPSQYPPQGPPQQQPQGPPQEQQGHELQPQSPPPAVTKA